MLSLLLDEQISPVVADQIAIRRPEIRIQSIYRWRHDVLTGVPDELVLQAAAQDALTLVTYDLKTIPPLLTEWCALRIPHAGVVFVDDRTIAPDDFGGLVRALIFLWEQEHERDWTDRIVFLGAA